MEKPKAKAKRSRAKRVLLPPSGGRWWTLAEGELRYGIPRGRLGDMVRNDEFPGARFGPRTWLLGPESAIDAWFAARQNGTAAALTPAPINPPSTEAPPAVGQPGRAPMPSEFGWPSSIELTPHGEIRSR
jgi:hypothetical protein